MKIKFKNLFFVHITPTIRFIKVYEHLFVYYFIQESVFSNPKSIMIL